MRYLPVLLVVALTLYCLIDCAQARGEAVRGLPKPAWLLLIVVAPVAGSVGWLVAGRPGRSPRPGGPGGRPGPQGPDDDPDFLRGLGGPSR